MRNLGTSQLAQNNCRCVENFVSSGGSQRGLRLTLALGGEESTITSLPAASSKQGKRSCRFEELKHGAIFSPRSA